MTTKYLSASIFFLLLVPTLRTMNHTRVDKSYDPEKSLSEHKSPLEDDDKNSLALNSFLEDVLRAKDQLKWIDRTINSQRGYHEFVGNTKRRLLWSRNRRSAKKKRRHERNLQLVKRIGDDDKEEGRSQDLSAANELDIEAILDSLEFSGGNSPSRNLKQNVQVEKRHYPVADLTGNGIIEYYDYEEEVGKRDSSDSFNSTIESTSSTSESSTELQRKDSTTHETQFNFTTEGKNLFPKQEFISNRIDSPQAKKFVLDRSAFKYNNDEDAHIEKENEGREVYLSHFYNDADDGGAIDDGREAPYHRDQDDEERMNILLRSHFVEIDEFEIVPENSKPIISESDQNLSKPRLRKDSQPDKTHFFLSPTQTSEVNEKNDTKSSENNYHALKSTDDLFKGGIEQGNSADEDLNLDQSSGMNNKWKSIEASNQNKGTKENHQNGGNNMDTLEVNKESRDRRSSSNLGPIMHRESVAESPNWPWDDYDNKDNLQIRFGRGLMQAFNVVESFKNNNIECIERTSADGPLRKITRRRDTFHDSKVLWRPRALLYLHPRTGRAEWHKPFIKGKHKFLKNRSVRSLNLDGVKKQSDGVPQVARFSRMLAGDNAGNDSQMSLAVGSQLADKIVDQIFQQVQKSEQLRTKLGPGLHRGPKPKNPMKSQKESVNIDNQDEVKHTEGMMKKVVELLGHLISDEVQRKTCTKLPLHLQEFLVWMVGEDSDSHDFQVHDGPPLPPVHQEKETPDSDEKSNNKFLFPTSPKPDANSIDPNDLQRKVRLLKRLIEEYNSLSKKEQTKVQTVHDYLERQLILLLKFIESKAEHKGHPSSAVSPKKRGDEYILQYQNAAPNVYEGESDAFVQPIETEMDVKRRRRRQIKRKKPKKKKKKKKKRKNKKKLKKNKYLHRLRRSNFADSNDFGRSSLSQFDHRWSLSDGYCSTTCESQMHDEALEEKLENSTETTSYGMSESSHENSDVTNFSVSPTSPPLVTLTGDLRSEADRLSEGSESNNNSSFFTKLAFSNRTEQLMNNSTGRSSISSRGSPTTSKSAKILENNINVFPTDT